MPQQPETGKLGKWDVAPHVNLLRSLRADRFAHNALIGEAVDNSFDAGASKVVISVMDNEIGFADDGVGITLDRLRSLFTLGEHGAMDTTKLGRFGIGIKSQAINAGDSLELMTISKDGKYLASVNWRSLLRSGKWEIDYPIHKPSPVGAATGTQITIRDLQKCRPFSLERSAVQVAQMFRPALAGGKEIVINGKQIYPLPDPELTDVIDVELSLSGGRTAHLYAGILAKAAASTLSRVHVEYKHRVIMPNSTIGCGEYSGLTKMFARLRIDGPWTLGKFKDDLPKDSERDELEDTVAGALLPILEKCSSASMSAKIWRMEELINASLPEDIRVRPKHKKKPARPTDPSQSKSNKTGEVDKDKSTGNDGPARSKQPPRNQLLITFDGQQERDGVGRFDPTSRPRRVELSKDDPFVARLIESRDEELAMRGLYALAMALFESHQPEPELPFESFGRRLSKHLAAQDYNPTMKAVG